MVYVAHFERFYRKTVNAKYISIVREKHFENILQKCRSLATAAAQIRPLLLYNVHSTNFIAHIKLPIQCFTLCDDCYATATPTSRAPRCFIRAYNKNDTPTDGRLMQIIASTFRMIHTNRPCASPTLLILQSAAEWCGWNISQCFNTSKSIICLLNSLIQWHIKNEILTKKCKIFL